VGVVSDTAVLGAEAGGFGNEDGEGFLGEGRSIKIHPEAGHEERDMIFHKMNHGRESTDIKIFLLFFIG
jgi:hypothetical protein